MGAGFLLGKPLVKTSSLGRSCSQDLSLVLNSSVIALASREPQVSVGLWWQLGVAGAGRERGASTGEESCRAAGLVWEPAQPWPGCVTLGNP